jgi:hypothetical protein
MASHGILLLSLFLVVCLGTKVDIFLRVDGDVINAVENDVIKPLVFF